MPAPKPVAATVIKWLKENLGSRCTAPLTTTDTAALRAAVQVAELYAYNRHPDILIAFRHIVLRMQTKCRELVYHSIAMVRDWPDRERMWMEAELPELTRVSLCKWEPANRHNLTEKERMG